MISVHNTRAYLESLFKVIEKSQSMGSQLIDTDFLEIYRNLAGASYETGFSEFQNILSESIEINKVVTQITNAIRWEIFSVSALYMDSGYSRQQQLSVINSCCNILRCFLLIFFETTGRLDEELKKSLMKLADVLIDVAGKKFLFVSDDIYRNIYWRIPQNIQAGAATSVVPKLNRAVDGHGVDSYHTRMERPSEIDMVFMLKALLTNIQDIISTICSISHGVSRQGYEHFITLKTKISQTPGFITERALISRQSINSIIFFYQVDARYNTACLENNFSSHQGRSTSSFWRLFIANKVQRENRLHQLFAGVKGVSHCDVMGAETFFLKDLSPLFGFPDTKVRTKIHVTYNDEQIPIFNRYCINDQLQLFVKTSLLSGKMTNIMFHFKSFLGREDHYDYSESVYLHFESASYLCVQHVITISRDSKNICRLYYKYHVDEKNNQITQSRYSLFLEQHTPLFSGTIDDAKPMGKFEHDHSTHRSLFLYFIESLVAFLENYQVKEISESSHQANIQFTPPVTKGNEVYCMAYSTNREILEKRLRRFFSHLGTDTSITSPESLIVDLDRISKNKHFNINGRIPLVIMENAKPLIKLSDDYRSVKEFLGKHLHQGALLNVFGGEFKMFCLDHGFNQIVELDLDRSIAIHTPYPIFGFVSCVMTINLSLSDSVTLCSVELSFNLIEDARLLQEKYVPLDGGIYLSDFSMQLLSPNTQRHPVIFNLIKHNIESYLNNFT